MSRATYAVVGGGATVVRGVDHMAGVSEQDNGHDWQRVSQLWSYTELERESYHSSQQCPSAGLRCS